jgi:GH15 family glucan-1,4-alpha-glucosidase
VSDAGRQRLGPVDPCALRDYALLADGERGALIGPHGEIVWMCFPRWDSPAVFSALLGGAGSYAISPQGRFAWGGYYEPGTLVWHSRWITEDGILECSEALSLPAERDRVTILRRVRALSGPARIAVVLDPRAEFGTKAPVELRRDEHGWTGRTGEIALRWTGAAGAEPVSDGRGGEALRAELELAEGDQRDLVLTLATGNGAGPPLDAERAWRETREAWSERVPDLSATATPGDCRHAYAVLAGMSSGGGGMVAAATTSLPERARAGRSYDYRYVWIRDQCYAGQAVARTGPQQLMDDAVGFVARRLLADGPGMMPAYTVDEGTVPDERPIELPGYPGGGDVAGNWVNSQFQLDAFGEALLLFAAAARHDHLDADAWRAAQIAADAIERRWRDGDRDAGVWELEPDAWTHSRLTCAAGLRALAGARSAGRVAGRWVALADAIVAETATGAVHRSGRWQRAPGDERVDAALLLAAIRGAVPAEDPRSVATLEAVVAELTDEGYCYRFRHDERPLGDAEGAFLLCGFWLSLAHHQQGDLVAAARCFERTRAACGPPGLFSEEYDVAQRQLRGNLPQAFVHAQLIEASAVQGDCPGPV